MSRDSKPNDEKKPKESEFVKFLKKRAFIYLPMLALVLVTVIPYMTEPKLADSISENLDENQKIAFETIKSYKGTNESGSSLYEATLNQIETAYSDEKKILQPETTHLIVTQQNNQNGEKIYQVNLSFDTFEEKLEYIWNVNLETGEIIPVNELARRMLDIVNHYN